MDTDSLCVQINTNDLYEDMKEIHDELDCSDYPKDHPLYSEVNKKVLGKFKDKLSGKVADEYVGLRAKMYSITWPGGNSRTCKCISKSVNKKVLPREM